MHCSEAQMPKTKTSPTSVALNEDGSMMTTQAMNGKKDVCAASAAGVCDKASRVGTEMEMAGREGLDTAPRADLACRSGVAIPKECNAAPAGPSTGLPPVPKQELDPIFPGGSLSKRQHNKRGSGNLSKESSIQCRLRISPAHAPQVSKPTCNLDTIAFVACQVADALSKEVVVKKEQNVSFTLPGAILGKRQHKTEDDWSIRKVHRKAAMTSPSHPCSSSRPQPLDPQRTFSPQPQPQLQPEDGSANNLTGGIPSGLVFADGNAMAGQQMGGPKGGNGSGRATLAPGLGLRPITTGSQLKNDKAWTSAEEQVGLALKTSTCRSAMKDVLEQFSDFKARVVSEFSTLRQEVETMHAKLHGVQVENYHLKQLLAACECPDGGAYQQQGSTGTVVPSASTSKQARDDGGLGGASMAAAAPTDGGGAGPSVPPAGGSHSSGSASSVGREAGAGGGCCEAGGAAAGRKGARRARGGVAKRKRLNWTAKENGDFLRLVRGHAGMEEMALRRMLAKFFAPKRTHEQCANHLRILRAQKKVPRAVGEAVPYRQKSEPRPAAAAAAPPEQGPEGSGG